MMDIYGFIVSEDIAEHCRKIAYAFTSIEMACIVYYSHKTLQEKHEAWKQIIDTQSDMVVEERIWTPYCGSLQLRLKDIMDIENKIVEVFRREEQNVIYYHTTCYDSNGDIFTDEENFQPTLDAIVKEIENYNKEYCSEPSDAKIEKVRIKKKWIGTNHWIDAEVSKNGTILSISSGEFLLSDEENSVRKSFGGMWFEVPTPFAKGDIVKRKSDYADQYREPFVFERICYQQETNSELSTEEWQCWLEQHSTGWDWTDMIVFGFAINDDGTIYHYHFSDYLSTEYYTGELNGKDRILTAVSNYLKGGVDEEFLLNTYDFMLLRENVKLKKSSYREEYLEEMLAKNDICLERKIVVDGNYDDIYSFITSLDIAEHCRKISHEFSALEQAVIVYHSDETLVKRHAAWENIIDTFTDEKAYKYHGIETEEIIFESLHEYLKAYMQIENKLTEKIKQTEMKTVYNYKIHDFYYDDSYNFFPSDNLFDSFENAFKAMIKEVAGYEPGTVEDFHLYVQKQWIDTDKKLSVRVDGSGEIVGKWEGMLLYFDEGKLELENDIIHQFNYLNVYVPVPFRRGDILSYKHGEPFILEDEDWGYVKEDGNEGLMYLAEGQINSVINSYTMKYGENVYWDFDLASLRIQYYRGELKGLHRALKVIGKHMKGEVSVAELMDIVDIIRSEERLKRTLPDGYAEEELVR